MEADHIKQKIVEELEGFVAEYKASRKAYSTATDRMTGALNEASKIRKRIKRLYAELLEATA